jgi:predicted DNA-binding transcriptional regulator YafY
VLAALPPERRSQAARIRERFHFEVPGWYRPADEVPFLAEVADAVWEQRVLRLRYRRWGQTEVDRLAHPYGVILKGGSWYLAAKVGDSVRTYRVGRILALEVLPERFERDTGFDLVTFWRRFAADFTARMYTAEAVIRLAPGGEDLLRYTIGDEVVAKALTDAEPDADGWTRLTIPVESVRHARWLLLRMGAQLEVLAPAELRALMAETVAELSEIYRK